MWVNFLLLFTLLKSDKETFLGGWEKIRKSAMNVGGWITEKA
jgi:hypothetical protein